jgi:hypothetical protein
MKRAGLTREQRQALPACYLEGGFDAAKPLAESFGARARYPAQLARKHDHTNYRRRGQTPVRQSDPRRQWAVARGPVSV